MSARYPLDNTGLSREKAVSRAWMFHAYRAITGFSHLPPEQQYWCLAGRLVDSAGKLQPLCEPLQAIGDRLIGPEQYIGVDHDPGRAKQNRRQAQLPLTLIESDIARALREYRKRGILRPGLINLDTAHEPRLAVRLLARVYRELRLIENGLQTVVFLNVLMSRYRRYDDDRVVEHISRVPLLAGDEDNDGMLGSGWNMLQRTHEYLGSGTASRSHMKIYCLFRGFQTAEALRAIDYEDLLT